MTSVYNIVSIVAFSLAGLCFLAAVFFWFKFDIWEIIGDLTGRTAKKTIEQMRAENEKNGKKSYRPTPIAVERGAKTEMIVHKIGEAANDKGDISGELPTEKMSNATEYLSTETELLDNATETLFQDTELLDGTELLSDTAKLKPIAENNAFVMLQNIVLIHTNEDIHI